MSRTALPLKCVTAETGGVWEEMLLRFSEDAGVLGEGDVHSGCGRNAEEILETREKMTR